MLQRASLVASMGLPAATWATTVPAHQRELGDLWRKHDGHARAAKEGQPCIGKRGLQMEASDWKMFEKKTGTCPSQKGCYEPLHQAGEDLDCKATST